MPDKKPLNILLLMTDQQRWDSLGAHGCDWAHTPNPDRGFRGGEVPPRVQMQNAGK